MPTVEQALVARAGPYILASRAREFLETAASAGCTPVLAPYPVELEPSFLDLTAVRAGQNLPTSNDGHLLWQHCGDSGSAEPQRYQVWVPAEAPLDWTRAELFLRQLRPLSHRMGLEFAGNKAELVLCVVVHPQDVPVLWAAFRAWQPTCELSHLDGSHCPGWQAQEDLAVLVRDYYPPPPYSHRFTSPEELRLSPLEAVLAALMEIAPPSAGLYQVLFQPVYPDHDWHRNVQLLLDLEYAIKLLSGSHLVPVHSSYPQQAPSGDLHHMAQDTQSKAHNDKPFYSVAVRVAVEGPEHELPAYMAALGSPLALFQHGGAPLRFLTEQDYSQVLSGSEIGTMLDRASTYRPGFLLNSAELSGLVHLPPGSALSSREAPMDLLETLPVRDTALMSGTPIGTCSLAGEEQAVCIPPDIRPRSTHAIARHGMGKSTLLEHMILHDLNQGHGVAVMDPHGDLIERLLCLIPEEHVDRTIYFDPGDPEWVPLWNPLSLFPGQDISRTADDLVSGVKSVVQGWGDRLEHLLRHGFYALLHLPQATFLDLSDLLRRKSEDSERLQRVIMESLDNDTARNFWKSDFDRYEEAALSPPKHKLSKLLVSGTTSLMLSQPENRIDLRSIMESQQVLLVDLHRLGPETRQILGSFLLSLMHTAALARSALPISMRHPFHIYCDEAHRFVTTYLEDVLVETRKFAVDVTLAHQFLRQFHASEVDALASVGTTIIFNVDARDAAVLLKDLRGKIGVEDLISLEVGEAIARIGTHVVRLKAYPPRRLPPTNYKQHILDRSHSNYCRRVQEVQESLRKRGRRWEQPLTPLTDAAADPGRSEEFEYDEFE